MYTLVVHVMINVILMWYIKINIWLHPIQLLSPVIASSTKDMSQPINISDNVWTILVSGVAIVAIVGLTYCLKHFCVTKKKKNEVTAISRVESMNYDANGIEMFV